MTQIEISEAKFGRPSSYRAEYCEKLIEHMKTGKSFPSFGALVGVHFDTLYEWVKQFPEFSEAKKMGETHAFLFWEHLGMQGIQGQLPKFNATGWIFSMKNKFRKVEQSELRSEKEAEVDYNRIRFKVLAVLRSPEAKAAHDFLEDFFAREDINYEEAKKDKDSPYYVDQKTLA